MGEYSVRNKARYYRLKAAKLCQWCGLALDNDITSRCLACREKHRAWRNASYKEIRKQVIEAYGSQCKCCAENNYIFLALDHVYGGGSKERKTPGIMTGATFYKKIIKENFPDKYQILCHNCNHGKYLNKGVCPHKEVATWPHC